jgi:hypothetical protein
MGTDNRIVMDTTALIKGKKYLYAPPDKEPVIWTY